MSSDAFNAWRAEHIGNGCRIEPVARLHAGYASPMRWGAFMELGTPRGREVSAFVTVPMNPELEREVPISRKAA